MLLLKFIFLIVLGGCATKYIVPSNRFITPESQGGAFNGQFELQATKGHLQTLNLKKNNVEDGVIHTTIARTGYMFSNSFFDSFDFIWSHLGGGLSMAGGKIQFLGASRTAKSTGHKLSGVFLVGGNEHETRDKTIKFRLDGQELLIIYGYRISENVLPYISVGQSDYRFEGELNPPLSKEPSLTTSVKGLNVGGEFTYLSFFGKVELSYQKIETSFTPVKNPMTFGISGGFSW